MTLTNLALVDQGKNSNSAVKGKASTIENMGVGYQDVVLLPTVCG